MGGGGSRISVDKEQLSVLAPSSFHGSIARRSRIFKKSITDDYTFSSKVVGTGFSGPVRLAKCNNTGRECAVKRYDKNAADDERIQYLKSEAEVYLLLDHPNICKLFAIYEDDRYVSIVMEYCAGMELSQRLHAKTLYSESDAAQVTRQMVEAVHYLHSHHVVHRDLKLENWLYEKDEPNNLGRLKLIDFGFSKLWHPSRSKKMEASCGSLTYVSPETLRGAYTNACDMWSLGVTVYFLLVGVPPFFGTERTLVDRILRGHYSMDGARWAVVSEDGKDFVCRLLQIDPDIRMTSSQALSHPWIVGVKCDLQTALEPSVLQSLREFAVASHLKRAALTMMAYSLTTNDIEDLALLFEEFDRNKDGSISLTDFMEVMRENFNISNTEIENLFNAMNAMEWGESVESGICYSDFVAAVLQTRLRFHEDAIREAFVKFDVDNSGSITAEDLRQVIGDTFEGVDAEELIRAADKNGDGRIDYQQFLRHILTEAEDVDQCVNSDIMETVKHVSNAEEIPLKKTSFMRQLLEVVDSSLAARDILQYGLSSKIMTASKSSPHILADIQGGYSYDPKSPHARPWDSRLLSTTIDSFALPSFVASSQNSLNYVPEKSCVGDCGFSNAEWVNNSVNSETSIAESYPTAWKRLGISAVFQEPRKQRTVKNRLIPIHSRHNFSFFEGRYGSSTPVNSNSDTIPLDPVKFETAVSQPIQNTSTNKVAYDNDFIQSERIECAQSHVLPFKHSICRNYHTMTKPVDNQAFYRFTSKSDSLLYRSLSSPTESWELTRQRYLELFGDYTDTSNNHTSLKLVASTDNFSVESEFEPVHNKHVIINSSESKTSENQDWKLRYNFDLIL